MTFKTRKLAAGTAIACLTLFSVVSSCKKSNSSSGSGALSATINSTNFQPTITTAVYEKANGFMVINGLQISGGDSINLQISIADTLKVNEVDSLSASDIYYSDSKSGNWYEGGGGGYQNGALKIISWDTAGRKIAGIFSGYLYHTYSDSLKVSNGRFNISYIIQ
jgi:hypothetical protein